MRTTHTVLTIDSSGSMSESDYPPTRLDAAREAARRFIKVKVRTRPRDRVAFCNFDSTPTTQFEFLKPAEALHEFDRTQLSAAGGTEIAPALEMASDLFCWPRYFASRQILLLTDGWDEGDFLAVGEELKADGVEIIVVGVGSRTDLNEGALRELASPGSYFFVGEISRLYALFEEIASDRIARFEP